MIYKTIPAVFSAETEEKKSRFIAHLVPIGQFDEVLEGLRADHRKANHHVTAFRRMLENGQIQEIGRDDGEPSGTSGMPVLKTMIGAQLMDCAIIVTRYFGGVKLGTGGLARAYSGAARAVIDAAPLEPWVQLERLELNIPFDRISELEREVATRNLAVISRSYNELGAKIVLEGAEKSLADFTAAWRLK